MQIDSPMNRGCAKSPALLRGFFLFFFIAVGVAVMTVVTTF
jgi:hypothetical protein